MPVDAVLRLGASRQVGISIRPEGEELELTVTLDTPPVAPSDTPFMGYN